jgi:hypothetical protein
MAEINDGERLLTALHADPELADVPVAIWSSSTRRTHVAQTFGIKVLIDKPFDLDELIEKVARLTASRPMRIERQPRWRTGRDLAAISRAHSFALVQQYGRVRRRVEHGDQLVAKSLERLATVQHKLAPPIASK